MGNQPMVLIELMFSAQFNTPNREARMSNAILNVRFGEWHFQIIRDRPWISLSHNPYQADARRTEPGWRWFEIY